MRVPSWLYVPVLWGCHSETKVVEPSSETQVIVDADGDGFLEDEDCDDEDASVHPGEVEVCDGVDNNCDGFIDEGVNSTFYMDNDGDGFGDASTIIEACEVPEGYVPNANDCDDTFSDVYPGGTEICDELDNNCDGSIDEGVGSLYYFDGDGDGYGTQAGEMFLCTSDPDYSTQAGDCDDNNNTVYPTALEVCDARDNDCNGEVDEGVGELFYMDDDGDGFGNVDQELISCVRPTGYVENILDCDDADSAIYPGAQELCDEIDNNCDGSVDEQTATDATVWFLDADGDGYGIPTSTMRSCSQPAGYVDNAEDCDDGNSSIFLASTWYLDYDQDGYGDDAYTIEVCQQPNGYVANNSDCNDADPLQNPNTLWYLDLDGDGYGANVSTTQCAQPSGFVMNADDCDDTEELAYTGATEVCDNVDNDCDGDVDENVLIAWYLDSDGDGYGEDSTIVEACSAPTSFYVALGGDCNESESSISPGAIEACDDTDNNCDGLIDNDADGDGYSDASCGGSDCDDGEASISPAQVGGCAMGETCLDILNQGKSTGSGLYEIDLDGYNTGADPVEVYCDMTTDGGGWTLIESYDISNRWTYYNASFFDYDLPRNRNAFNWDDYRLDLQTILSLFDASSEFHARCHRDYGSSPNDYIFADIILLEQDFSAHWLDSNTINPYNMTCKVRGYDCASYGFRWWHGTSGSYNWHAGFDVSGYLPGSVSSEDSFTWHEGLLNSNHLCHTTAGDIVWMVR